MFIFHRVHIYQLKLFQLICKFFYMNHEWTIEEYDRRRDPAKQVRRYKLVKIGLIRDTEHCKC